MSEGRVAVVGAVGDDVVRALAQARIEVDEHAHLVLARPGGETLSSLVRAGRTVVALVDDDEAAETAISDGAVDAMVGLPSPDLLRTRLGALFRLDQRWRARLDEQRAEARRTLSDLQQTRDLMRQLIDAIPNPVMAADLRGRILSFNRSAEQVLGYDPAWVLEHLHVTDIYAEPVDARRVYAEIRASPNGVVHGIEVRLRARSGEQIPVRLSAAEVYSAGGLPIATVGVFEDRRAELSLPNRLEATTERLVASEKRALRLEVAGAAAHELNQPLTAVMGTIEHLSARSDLPEEMGSELDRVYTQLQRMAEIVRSLGRTSQPQTIADVGRTRILDLNRDSD